jgi:uncharacterized protein
MNNLLAGRPQQLLLSVVLLMAIIALGAYANLTFKQAEYMWGGPTTITVTGEGEVVGIPDIGQFTFSVEADGSDAGVAQSASAEKVNAIVSYLKESGVAETDIKTEGYNLFPKYRYEDRVCPMGSFCPSGEPIQDGFTVSQSVQVKVRDLAAAGGLMSGVGERGATNLSGLMFTIDDTTELEAEAQALAITDAQTKAKTLADSLGVRIVRMTGFYEESNNYPMPYGMGGDMMMAEAKSASVTPDIPAGEQTTTKRVSVTFEVR